MADSDAVPDRRRTVPRARVLGRNRAKAVALELGTAVRQARERRRLTQRELAERVAIGQTRQSQIELGDRGTPLELLFAEAEALGLFLNVKLGRDPKEELADAGHLPIQELILRLARLAGRARTFELTLGATDPARSVDVCVRDDVHRVFQINECWNTITDLGRAVRSTRSKIAEAEHLAVAVGGARGAYRVTACWVVRDTRRNRELLNRYPEIFAATFTGDSADWVAALTSAEAEAPANMGVVLCDITARRLVPWRRNRP